MGKRKQQDILISKHAVERFIECYGGEITHGKAGDLLLKYYMMARRVKPTSLDGSMKYRYEKWTILVKDGCIVTCIHSASPRYSAQRGT